VAGRVGPGVGSPSCPGAGEHRVGEVASVAAAKHLCVSMCHARVCVRMCVCACARVRVCACERVRVCASTKG
jgi:hypothetical protein